MQDKEVQDKEVQDKEVQDKEVRAGRGAWRQAAGKNPTYHLTPYHPPTPYTHRPSKLLPYFPTTLLAYYPTTLLPY